jgi:ribosomal protein L16 Arg81 hydroxylase
LAAAETNDFYMIAQNRNLQKTALRELFEDVEFPEYLNGQYAPFGSALWLGPAGTVTPLHHDTSSILFCQIYGRKRIVLVSPFETALLDAPRGVYSNFDCEAKKLAPELARATRKVVELAPGETLFIPVAWWHHVRALEVSISLALNNFRLPNDYEWYKPGLVP